MQVGNAKGCDSRQYVHERSVQGIMMGNMCRVGMPEGMLEGSMCRRSM